MRLRMLVAALAIFGAITVAPGAIGTAGATEIEDPTEIVECLEEAAELRTDPEKCQEAPNPIIPEPNEIIWGGLAFLVVFFVLAKYGYPPVKKMMDDRSERIRSDLARSEEARTESEDVLARYEAQLADAKGEAARIIEEARQQADVLRRDLEARAGVDVAEMRERAQADIEASKQQAVADLTAEVASLALRAAELVVQRNLDRDTNVELIEDYIDQVGRRS